MSPRDTLRAQALSQRLVEAEATIEALLSGQIDAVVDSKSHSPVLLSKAQTALRDSEERYRRIVETANEGIVVIDGHEKLVFANRRFAELLGYASQSMVGMSTSEFIPESGRAAAACRVDRSRRGLSEESEVSYLRKDGTEVWALLKTSPINAADGTWAGTLAMLTDWTRHRAAEEALRKSEEQYRQIVECTSDGIIKSDSAERIVFVNRRLADMLGYEPKQMVGASVFAFMSAEAATIASAAFQRRRRREKDSYDTTFRHQNGTEIAVNIAGTPLIDAQGAFTGTLGVVRDITEEKKLQAQLMVSDRMASMGTLAAGVAHEINNPLAVVIANLDFLVDSVERTASGPSSTTRTNEASREDVRSALVDAREAADRVRLIVRDLKIFSRSPSEEAYGPVDVKAIIESSLRMGWNEIRHRARLVKSYGVVPSVEGNEARLGQVFLNLIVNAAQAIPEGQAENNELSVSTRLEGDRVVVEVRDTGAGIPPAILGRVFDAFFTTKAVGVGTGLGLAICQRIVTDMGGELTVQSELGKGACFRVALPIATSRPSKPPGPKEPPALAGRRGRILVVDDEVMVTAIVKRTLSKEHDVVALVAAKDALALCARGERFDLILCDLMMPDMTGMDLHRELSVVAPDQAEKMIFMTGGAFTAAARAFLSDAHKEHIEKPFDVANVRAIVRRCLR